MSGIYNTTVIYKLAGRSLEAARRLAAELEKELRLSTDLLPQKIDYDAELDDPERILGKEAPQKMISATEVDPFWLALFDRLRARLEKEAPGLLAATGLISPSTQVFHDRRALPRAYEAWPEIYAAEENGETAYYMSVPTNYKGEHFVPEDSLSLTPEEETRLHDLYVTEAWNNPPLVALHRRGVPTPSDDATPADRSAAFTERVCYRAEGRTLELIQNLRAREAAWERQMAEIRAAIKDAVEKSLPGGGKNMRIFVTPANRGPEPMRFAIHFQNPQGAMLQAPTLPDIEFKERYPGGRSFFVIPRDTTAGRALERLIAALPPHPSLLDYPELLRTGETRLLPKIEEFDGVTVVSYIGPGTEDPAFPPPPGAARLPLEAYHWLRADNNDREEKISPPPMPPRVRNVVQRPSAWPRPQPPRP